MRFIACPIKGTCADPGCKEGACKTQQAQEARERERYALHQFEAKRIDGVARRLARREIAEILRKHALKVARTRPIEFADGKFTMEQLIDRRLAKHGERLRKEARAKVKAE